MSEATPEAVVYVSIGGGIGTYEEAKQERVMCLGEPRAVASVKAVLAEVMALRSQLDEAVRLLRTLVELKDGPRDATYEQEKPKAWAASRAFLLAAALIKEEK